MNPDSRMAISLLLSLAVSYQNLRMAAMGEADIVIVGVRYVVGFVVAFVLVGAAGRLFNDYVAVHEAARLEAERAEQEAERERERQARAAAKAAEDASLSEL